MIEIKSIHMDYETNPVGTNGIPQIGWEIVSDRKNVMQKWYRLQVSDKADFSLILWDSGKKESEQSSRIWPEGLSVEKAHKYFVRVSIGDREEESAWSAPSFFVTSLGEGGLTAPFVSAQEEEKPPFSRGTYVRGSFFLSGEIEEAYAFTSALGLYEFYLNGQKVGHDEMTPGWTSYNRHLLYQTYDVTQLLRTGENVAGASLGAGWYRGSMGLTRARNNYGEKSAFAMCLHIRYKDDRVECIMTDRSWTGCDSPVVFSEIYDGEIYDASLEIEDWCIPGSNYNSAWRKVTIETVDSAVIKPQAAGRVAVMGKLHPKRIFTTPQGEKIVDFGQNMAGRPEFAVWGKEGDIVEICCFETLDMEGNVYVDNLRTAKQTVKYIFGRAGRVVWQPHFTYMGFQYIHVRHFPGELTADSLTACVLHTKMEQKGNFFCSNELLNRLHHNILWGMKSNFIDVPTDCPQRDERLGWTGDAQIFCRTACYLMGTYTFYKKWLQDLKVDQTKEGGVPHVIPNIEEGHTAGNWLLSQGEHSAAAWADAAVIIPWTLYLMYGDRHILELQYESMKAWIDFMQCNSKDYIWNYKLQFGDWLALDASEGSYFGATPNDLTCTAYYAYSTGLFAKIASVLNKPEAKRYRNLYDTIVKKFQETFFDKEGRLTSRTQTAHIIALYFGLTPKKYIDKTVAALTELLAKEKGHLATGFVGTPYFCHVLSQNGCTKEAYDLLMKEDFPSWLYQVRRGATTIWEHWDGKKPDGSMWSADMNSFNHYAYGAIGEWLYRAMAGIETSEESPGFSHCIYEPHIGGNLSFVQAEYHSVYGLHRLRWEKNGRCVRILFCVPVNTTATLLLHQVEKIVENSGLCFETEGSTSRSVTGSGEYEICYVMSE